MKNMVLVLALCKCHNDGKETVQTTHTNYMQRDILKQHHEPHLFMHISKTIADEEVQRNGHFLGTQLGGKSTQGGCHAAPHRNVATLRRCVRMCVCLR